MAKKTNGATKVATTTASTATEGKLADQSELLPDADVNSDQAEKVSDSNVVLSDTSAALEALGFGQWPRTYRATNNTRMCLCIPAHGLTVERFGAHNDIVISSEDALTGLKSEMDAIAHLNGFGEKDFLLEHVAGE